MERNTTHKRGLVRRLLVPVLAVLVFLVALSAAGAFASLIDSTSRVTYTLKPAAAGCTVRKNYSVSNNGDIPVVVRAKVIVNWVDAEGNVVVNAEGGKYTVKTNENWTHLVEKSGDRKDITDGCWYYNGVLSEGSASAPLLDDITVKESPANAKRLEVKLLVEALQAEGETADGTPAPKSAWNVRATFYGSNLVAWELP